MTLRRPCRGARAHGGRRGWHRHAIHALALLTIGLLLALQLLHVGRAAQLVVVSSPATRIGEYPVSGVYGLKLLLKSGATAVLIGVVLDSQPLIGRFYVGGRGRGSNT